MKMEKNKRDFTGSGSYNYTDGISAENQVDQQMLSYFKYSIEKILHENDEFDPDNEDIKELVKHAKLLGVRDLNDLDMEVEDEEQFMKLNEVFKKSQKVRKFKKIHVFYITAAALLFLSLIFSGHELYKNKRLRDKIADKLNLKVFRKKLTSSKAE